MAASFGSRLRALREQAGLSQPALARMVPISQSSLSRYESGRQAAAPDIAARLDELLHADGELVGLVPPIAAGLVLTPDDRARIERHIAYPSRLDGETVRALAAVLAAQRRLDDVFDAELLIPSVLAQMATVTGMARHVRGPHRQDLIAVASEYAQFSGWLYAESRQDSQAVSLLAEAEGLADEAGNDVLAAQVMNFRGYIARHRGNARGVVRWFLAEYLTPGAHIAQRVGAAAQAAQGYASLGRRDEALRLLDVAGEMIDVAAREEPPATAYWLTPTFHNLNVGLAHLALADHATAADHLRIGLEGLPDDQQGAEWAVEYHTALHTARQLS